MLTLEGQVDFITGLAAIFASNYNFNLKYAEDASCTLEFTNGNFYIILYLRA